MPKRKKPAEDGVFGFRPSDPAVARYLRAVKDTNELSMSAVINFILNAHLRKSTSFQSFLKTGRVRKIVKL